MDHTSIDIYLVIDTFLLLLIGVGPKIALVPFLEVTSEMDPATKALVVRKMLTTAGVVAVRTGVRTGPVSSGSRRSPRSVGCGSLARRSPSAWACRSRPCQGS